MTSVDNCSFASLPTRDAVPNCAAEHSRMVFCRFSPNPPSPNRRYNHELCQHGTWSIDLPTEWVKLSHYPHVGIPFSDSTLPCLTRKR